jgi:hypothetical protein
MKPKPLGPAKSFVRRTPAEELARIDAQIAETAPRAKRLRTFAGIALIGGLALAAAISAVFWFLKGWIVIWGLPAFVLGGGVAAVCMRSAGALENQLRAQGMGRRKLAREAQAAGPLERTQ